MAAPGDERPAPVSYAVEVLVDGSASMKARLPSGVTRLEGALRAVEAAVGTLPPDTPVAVRVWGTRSPASRRDCEDTKLVRPFAAAANARADVVEAAGTFDAQGGTPLARALQEAANDFEAAPASRGVVVIVADGKDTCGSDPCATADALKAKRPWLVVHAVGLAADTASRMQLECVARATGGVYFDSTDAAAAARAVGTVIGGYDAPTPPAGDEAGAIEVPSPDPRGQKVTNSVTGKTVATIDPAHSVATVPPGIYQVGFGKDAWRGIRVDPGRRIVLEPGQVKINGAGARHDVVETETGRVVATLTGSDPVAALLPGVYDVTIGGTAWWHLTVDAGRTTVLTPGRLRILNPRVGGRYALQTSDARAAGEVTSADPEIALPGGPYRLELPSRAITVTVVPGRLVEIDAAGR